MARSNHLSQAVLLLLILALGLSAQETPQTTPLWSPSALRAGDVLQISIFRAQEFDRTVRVEEDGAFSFPLCGIIQAAGLNTRQVAQELEKRLAAQLADPHVDVTVSTWGPRTVYLLGEFKSGSLSMELPTYSYLTALQAISAAGGFTESADLANVAVLRHQPNGEYQRIPVDVSVLLGNPGVTQEIILMPEDTLLAPRAASVSLSGKVVTPTTISIDTKRPPHLSEVLVRAGGMETGADIDRIAIVRQQPDGTQTVLEASLRPTGPGTYANDPLIQPGDHVVVSAARQVFVTGQVSRPMALELPTDTPITVSQAVTMAGGFTPTASKGNVTLIRGTQRFKVDMGKLYAKEGNQDKDLILQYGDIVYVPESFW